MQTLKNTIHSAETITLNLLLKNTITLTKYKAKMNMVIGHFEVHRYCGKF